MRRQCGSGRHEIGARVSRRRLVDLGRAGRITASHASSGAIARWHCLIHIHFTGINGSSPQTTSAKPHVASSWEPLLQGCERGDDLGRLPCGSTVPKGRLTGPHQLEEVAKWKISIGADLPAWGRHRVGSPESLVRGSLPSGDQPRLRPDLHDTVYVHTMATAPERSKFGKVHHGSFVESQVPGRSAHRCGGQWQRLGRGISYHVGAQ